MHIEQLALGKRLREARINSGLNQEEVANALGIPRTAIVHIESGNRAVSTIELAGLANLFHRPIADFFREFAAAEEDVLTALGRISNDFQNNPRVQHEIANHVSLCRQGVSLRSVLELDAHSAPPEYPVAIPTSTWEAVQQGQAIAREERRRLALGDNPIPDMADLIASEGIWASGTHLPDEISGMFLRHSSFGMVILVNYDHPRARKRFSYSHEYAHALLDRSTAVTVSRFADRDELSEVRANAFAAAFLMPDTGVSAFLAQRNKGLGSRETIPVYDSATESLGMKVQALWRSAPGSQQINYQLVARLAYHFGVSYQAACYRLRGLKILAEQELKELLAKDGQALHFLEILKIRDDLEGQDDDKVKKPDRELVFELLSLAVEAFKRELITKTRFIEVGQLVGIDRKDMLDLGRE
jgi:Zn-dependent peptidase ImmA (M78 family)/DNA-binding XRE family transcriptional regulator